LFGFDGEVSAQVRKVCSIQNLTDSRYVAQHAESIFVADAHRDDNRKINARELSGTIL
jgi:hypothetical protein